MNHHYLLYACPHFDIFSCEGFFFSLEGHPSWELLRRNSIFNRNLLPPCLYTQQCTWVQAVVGIQRASRESFISHIGLLRLFQLTEQFQQVTPVVLLLPVEWIMNNRHPKSTFFLNGLLLSKNNRSIAGFGSRLLATKGQSFPTSV